ncbi:MAG: helix-turn-helix domain-containing protein [Candidatus Moraniibacteriota bacterium]
MDIIKGLENLGLNEKQAKIYVALLQLGRASAYAAADKAGLKKPTTYVILGELMEKGLVTRVPRSRKQLFVAKRPEEFFALAEERLSNAKSILPDLLSMIKGSQDKVRTLYYEGLTGVHEALWYRMKEMKQQELVGFYATVEQASPELEQVFFDWHVAMAKHRFTLRVIAPEHPSLKKYREEIDPKYGHTVRSVSAEKYSAKISIDVGDTFVRIVAFRELQAIVIDNPDVAQTVRQIFELVWSGLE